MALGEDAGAPRQAVNIRELQSSAAGRALKVAIVELKLYVLLWKLIR
jgi:hypothetical protein